ncbi:MAG: gliding motility protein GldN [Bacteroidota bacterium]
MMLMRQSIACLLICVCCISTPQLYSQPLDEVAPKYTLKDRQVLPYPSIREADILWEKRIWREIDTRQTMNHPFRYPEAPLVNVLIEGIREGAIKAYSPEDDKFSFEMPADELASTISQSDTVQVMDPETYEITYELVEDDLNPEDIVKYRIKEVWFFDTRYSTLRVRILGIAPIKKVVDDNGNFRYEKPLFWIYYPHCREYLAHQRVFTTGNDGAALSWEDHLERRFFDSYIVKESNVHDRRIADYATGREALLESDNIKKEIFNYEHDLWSY